MFAFLMRGRPGELAHSCSMVEQRGSATQSWLIGTTSRSAMDQATLFYLSAEFIDIVWVLGMPASKASLQAAQV